MFDPSLAYAVGLSPLGASLLQNAAANGWDISIQDSDENKRLRSVFGYCDPYEKEVVVNADVRAPEKVCTLAHELEHARQRSAGDWKAPGEDGYVDQHLENERKAESAANGVAYDLLKAGDDGPMRAQMDDRNPWQEQAKEYFRLREQQSLSHADAATGSEPLWDSAKQSEDYRQAAQRDHDLQHQLLPPDLHLAKDEEVDKPAAAVSESRAEILKRFDKLTIPEAPPLPPPSQADSYSM